MDSTGVGLHKSHLWPYEKKPSMDAFASPVTASTTDPPTTVVPLPPLDHDNKDNDEELAVWSSNTTCSFTGQVLSFEGSLGFDGLELFREAHIALERGSIYGFMAPNGSGKTSLARALPTLPGFPTPGRFRVEYLAADLDNPLSQDDDTDENADTNPIMEVSAREYCLSRVSLRVQDLENEIEQLESSLETASDNEEMEKFSDQLGELYETKDELELKAAAEADQMFVDLKFGDYPDQAFGKLSSGWKYKCQLVSALLTRPDLLIIDEPSFLDTQATAWFVTRLQTLAKSQDTMMILISHKEALLEELCDRILYLNPASRTLMVYHCGFREFQAAHVDQVAYAQKSKDQADAAKQQAQQSLGQIRQQLRKREHNSKAKTFESTDKRWTHGKDDTRRFKGKNKEAKQKADHSVASKVKRLQKEAKVLEEQQALFLQAKVPPLELEGADTATDRPLVELVDMDFQYEGSSDMLLEFVNCQIAGNDKILIQGANGQGKSTLVKLILGQLEPSHGEVRRSACTTAHFHQDALSELVRRYGHKTPVDFLHSRNENLGVMDARTHLGRFGLKGSVAVRLIRSLSAGQRVRLWLSREFLEAKPSLLILDEATENLDKKTTDSLLESLEGFSAAILAISHDEYFSKKYPATQVWTIGHGRARVQFK